MTEETARLTLAFIGDQEVHRNNARSLLEDFVDGWQKQHRHGEVHVVLPEWGDVPPETIGDLDDWAGTAGYSVSYEEPVDMLPLLLEATDARLILVGDPNDDDMLYDVAEEAAKYRIQTRSLINGLEKVVFDDEDFDDDLAGEGFHEVDVETGEGWVEDDLSEEEAESFLKAVDALDVDVPDEDELPDLDMLASLADDGEVEAQEEIKLIAATLGIDVAPFETWVDAVSAVRDYQVTVIPADHPVFDDDEEDAILVVADGPVELTRDDLEEILEARPAPDKKHTREELEKMSFDDVKALGLEYGVAPGRGMKHGVYVNKILQLSGVETPADQAKPKRKRGRPSKLEAVPAETAEAETPNNITAIRSDRVVTLEVDSVVALIDGLRTAADALDALVATAHPKD